MGKSRGLFSFHYPCHCIISPISFLLHLNYFYLFLSGACVRSDCCVWLPAPLAHLLLKQDVTDVSKQRWVWGAAPKTTRPEDAADIRERAQTLNDERRRHPVYPHDIANTVRQSWSGCESWESDPRWMTHFSITQAWTESVSTSKATVRVCVSMLGFMRFGRKLGDRWTWTVSWCEGKSSQWRHLFHQCQIFHKK